MESSKVNENLNRQIDGLEKIEKKVNKVLIPLWQQVPYYTTIATALMMVGLFQFASVGFDPDKLLEAQFWITIGIISVAIMIIFTSTAKEYTFKYAEDDKDIKSIKATINEKSKNQSFIKLPEFLTNKNIELRIQRWKEILDTKERKLDNKASESDIYIYSKGTLLEKKDNKYTFEKEKISNLRSNDYINSHIAYMKLPKLLQYTMAMISADVATSEKSAFVENDGKIILKEATYRVITRTAFSAALATLIITTNAISLDTIIKLIGNLFILVITFFDAVLLARSIVNNVIKGRAVERLQILDEYYTWVKLDKIDKKALNVENN